MTLKEQVYFKSCLHHPTGLWTYYCGIFLNGDYSGLGHWGLGYPGKMFLILLKKKNSLS